MARVLVASERRGRLVDGGGAAGRAGPRRRRAPEDGRHLSACPARAAAPWTTAATRAASPTCSASCSTSGTSPRPSRARRRRLRRRVRRGPHPNPRIRCNERVKHTRCSPAPVPWPRRAGHRPPRPPRPRDSTGAGGCAGGRPGQGPDLRAVHGHPGAARGVAVAGGRPPQGRPAPWPPSAAWSPPASPTAPTSASCRPGPRRVPAPAAGGTGLADRGRRRDRGGRHDGAYRFTVGQRRGLGLSGGDVPRYVTRIDGPDVHVGPRTALATRAVEADHLTWIAGTLPAAAEVTAQVRYRGAALPAVIDDADGERLRVSFPPRPRRAWRPARRSCSTTATPAWAAPPSAGGRAKACCAARAAGYHGDVPDAAPSRTVDLAPVVHYLDYDGLDGPPPLVCVHGLGGSHAEWAGFAVRMAARSRVLVPDLAGFGRTPPGDDPADVDGNRRLLDRFLDRVAGRPVVVVGSSMGGLIAMREAVEAPDRLAGLVLVDPSLPRPRFGRPDPLVGGQAAAVALDPARAGRRGAAAPAPRAARPRRRGQHGPADHHRRPRAVDTDTVDAMRQSPERPRSTGSTRPTSRPGCRCSRRTPAGAPGRRARRPGPAHAAAPRPPGPPGAGGRGPPGRGPAPDWDLPRAAGRRPPAGPRAAGAGRRPGRRLAGPPRRPPARVIAGVPGPVAPRT